MIMIFTVSETLFLTFLTDFFVQALSSVGQDFMSRRLFLQWHGVDLRTLVFEPFVRDRGVCFLVFTLSAAMCVTITLAIVSQNRMMTFHYHFGTPYKTNIEEKKRNCAVSLDLETITLETRGSALRDTSGLQVIRILQCTGMKFTSP